MKNKENMFIQKILDGKNEYREYLTEYHHNLGIAEHNRKQYEKDLEIYKDTPWIIRFFKGMKKPVRDSVSYKDFEYLGTRANPLEEFIKELKKTSPDFDMLWDMSDFLKYANQIWMAPGNGKMNVIYSSTKYEKNQNGFIIKKDDGKKSYSIIVKLYPGEGQVAIECRNIATNTTFTYFFVNNDWKIDPSTIDRLTVEFAEKVIMDTFCEIFEECYLLTNNEETLF